MTDAVAIQLDLDINLQTVRQRGQEIGNILERSLNRNTRLQALNRLERQIEQVRERVRGIQTDLHEAMTTEVETPEFANITRELEQQRNVLEQIIREYAEIAHITEEESRNRVNSGMFNIFTQRGMIPISQIQQMVSAYERLRNQQEALVESGRSTFIDTEAIERFRNELDLTTDQMHELLLRYQELSMQSGNEITNSLQPIINFNQEIGQTVGALQQAFGPYIQMAVTAIRTLIEVTEKEIELLQRFGQVAIAAFKPLVSMAQLAGKAIGKMFDSIKKHNETTMKNLWRNILRYGIGVRSMYFLVRKIRSAIGDVINELSRQIPEVNAKMSEFKTAVNGLKGALATAFQPILTAVLPILTKLINMVSRAIAVIGQFFALLTGQKFVYAATATQVDYAASLDKTGKSAKKAKKELEGYLSPIDEINKFQDKNKDNDSGGGADGGDYTLKKVPIDDWMKDLFDKIKQAWEHADFTDIGKMIGDKLAKMLAMIPWADIRAKARQLGRSLATLLNGIMHGEFNGKSLATYVGQTIAGALNTAFDFVDSWVSAFEWDTLGKSIMEVIAGALDNIDWNLITGTLSRIGTGLGQLFEEMFNDLATWQKMGDAVGRFVNSIIYMISNFFNEIEGVEVGAAISRFLKGAIERIDTKGFATMCNMIMNDLLDALIVAVKTTPWDTLGEKLAGLINGIDFKTIFGKYAKLASSIIDAILDLLENFLVNLDPKKVADIGDDIADAINNIDFQAERLGKVANALLSILFKVIREAVSKVDWNKVGQDIEDFLNEIDWASILGDASAIKTQIEGAVISMVGSIFEGIASTVLGDAQSIGGMIVRGLISGIMSMTPVGSVIKIFMDIVMAVKSFLGIHSPSTVFRDIGINIVEGFFQGIRGIVDKAKEVWEKLKAKTIEIYEAIRAKVIEKATQLKTNVVEIYENIKTKLTDTVTNIKTKVVETWESMKSSVVKIFEDMWGSIKGVINSILGGVERMVNGIIDGFNKAINAMNNLQFDVPGWVPIVGGNHLGFNIPTMSNISIPRLAQGAVIPPNKEFMAMLGDQKSGTNIETPLSTMVEAFNQALAQNGGNGKTEINFLLPDRRKVAQYVVEGGRIWQTSTGKNPFDLA